MKSNLKHLLLLIAPLLVATGCNFTTNSPLPGQRLLSFEILLYDQNQFTGFLGVNDHLPVPQMWNVLPEVTFEPVEKESILNDPRQATVSYKGNVLIRMKHVDEELDSIATENLTLSRSATTNAWSLNPKDIERLQSQLQQR